ncbi:MAG: tryptophan synthase subunit alpha [Acidimicrobiia bacterium]
MGAERIAALLEHARAVGRTALLPFMTAGLPDPETSPGIFRAMAEAGADAFEVGIPYSDPIMDGPVIHEGSRRALRAGTDLARAFGVVEAVGAVTGKPILVMTYANPVFRVGPEEFCRLVVEAGGDGLIVPDLPVEEASEVRAAAEEAGLGMVLFLAPTSDGRRLRAVAEARPVFIYGVADLGVTGERAEASSRAGELAERVRAVTDLPLVLGVGISTPDQARAVAEVADGVIVGSALVRRVLEAGSAEEAGRSAGRAVADLAAALH